MYDSLWVTQQVIYQRTAERKAQAAAHRLAKQIQHDRGNRPLRRFSRIGLAGLNAPAIDAHQVTDPPANLAASPELVDAAATTPCP
jgi:hypothetical protein